MVQSVYNSAWAALTGRTAAAQLFSSKTASTPSLEFRAFNLTHILHV